MADNGGWTTAGIPDQSGKIVIVTGANSGLGYETSLALSAKGARVIMACRNMEKGAAALAQCRVGFPSAELELKALDLADLNSIRQFSTEFRAENERLDLLINNAGIMAVPYARTADGFEMQFGTNHLGHFALTGHLIDLLMATREARVVTISSFGHAYGKIDFDNLNAQKSYSKWGAYNQSKLANILFVYELQRRLDSSGSNTISVGAHPGYSATNLQKSSGLFSTLNHVFAQNQEMGVLPQLYAATAPGVQNGGYYGPDGFAGMRGYPKGVDSSAASHEQAVARRLWDISEELTGVRYAALEQVNQGKGNQ